MNALPMRLLRGWPSLLATAAVLIWITVHWKLPGQPVLEEAWRRAQPGTRLAGPPTPSPQERAEEEALLRDLRWPSPPRWPVAYEATTSAARSWVEVTAQAGRLAVGGTLEVTVRAHDHLGRPKSYGGDFLEARLLSVPVGRAAVPAVRYWDRGDGTYGVAFPLPWAGVATVAVSLVHPAEAVHLLARLREERPDKVYFRSLFRLGSLSETTECNVLPEYLSSPSPSPSPSPSRWWWWWWPSRRWPRWPSRRRRWPRRAPGGRALCDLSGRSEPSERWVCVRPRAPELPCSSRRDHSKGGYHDGLLTPGDERLLQTGVNLRTPIPVLGSDRIAVHPRPSRTPHAGTGGPPPHHHPPPPPPRRDRLPVCSPGPPPGYGYYLRGDWLQPSCRSLRFRRPERAARCLAGKRVHLVGDSNVRQWFEHLVAFVPTLHQVPTGAPRSTGPLLAVDAARSTSLRYHCHGPPIRFTGVPADTLRWEAPRLARLEGGRGCVVALSLGAHFTSFPLGVFVRRARALRRALGSLLAREPATTVVVRTANTQAQSVQLAPYGSDWLARQQNSALRRLLSGLPLGWVDAWAMNVAHWGPPRLHPEAAIVHLQVEALLSYACPDMDDDADDEEEELWEEEEVEVEEEEVEEGEGRLGRE
uniref:NXPE family member 3-like n=1 Tax=Petromyzon marinus TaxID=7757 RepID=A0AAJ7UB23_PETMA|nr:NXPE family member 3-like [Petromyzon marinus]